jgi:hypothetical protein
MNPWILTPSSVICPIGSGMSFPFLVAGQLSDTMVLFHKSNPIFGNAVSILGQLSDIGKTLPYVPAFIVLKLVTNVELPMSTSIATISSSASPHVGPPPRPQEHPRHGANATSDRTNERGSQ